MLSQTAKLKSQKSGFTLIELIIYLAIVSMILVSISYLIIDLSGGQTKNIANQEVIYNLRLAHDKLSRDIRSAQAVSSIAPDALVLDMPGEDITYIFDASGKKLTRQVGSDPAIDLLSDVIEVSGNFTDQTYLTRVKNIGVDLVLNYKNPDKLPEYNASTTISFSVELRGRR